MKAIVIVGFSVKPHKRRNASPDNGTGLRLAGGCQLLREERRHKHVV